MFGRRVQGLIVAHKLSPSTLVASLMFRASVNHYFERGASGFGDSAIPDFAVEHAQFEMAGQNLGEISMSMPSA